MDYFCLWAQGPPSLKAHFDSQRLSEEILLALQKVLPRRGSQSDLLEQLVTVLQGPAVEEARVFAEQLILENLLRDGRGKKALVHTVVDLGVLALLARHLLKLLHDAGGGVVAGAGVDLLSEESVSVSDGCDDVFA